MERKEIRYKNGEITAFLSLIFVLLVSFILAMTESAQTQTEKNLKRLAVDRSIYSVFGEYQRDLLEEYGVFAIEGSYETGSFDEQQLLNRLIYYGSGGIEQTITDIQFLSDNGGQAFREQVLEYMETKTGIGILEDLAGVASSWEEQKIEGMQASEQLEALWEEDTALLPEQQEDFQNLTASGILSLVLPEGFALSGKAITKETQLSMRQRNQGYGQLPERSNTEGIKENLLFHCYLTDTFSSAIEQKSDSRNLDYEMEYLIGGKETDEENLKAVVRQILIARMGVNYAFLQTDSTKKSEAEAFAMTLATVTLHPELMEPIKQFILLLWAFGESTIDIRTLLDGKQVPLVKTSENWVLPIARVFTFAAFKMEYNGNEQGLGYDEYLQILLLFKKEETITMRTLDRVENNLRIEKDMDYFRIDACISKIKLENCAEIGGRYQYTFPVYYGYL